MTPADPRRRRLLSGLVALVAAGALAHPTAIEAQDGPSFDCRKARGYAERTICADPELADKDARMAQAYRSLVEEAREGGGPDADLSNFRAEQRRWLSERNRCRTVECLHASYDERIGDLTVDY